MDWSMVFPLGMYSAATHHMDVHVTAGLLAPLDTVFFGLALLAWAATAIARTSLWWRGARERAPVSD
jgi:tellurite resistance protein TehA-like permease